MEPSVQSGPGGEPRSNLSALLTVLDTIGALIFTKDRRGIYTYANQRFAEVVGLAPPDVPGKRTAELFDPDTARELDETDRLARAHVEGDLVKWVKSDTAAPMKVGLLLKQVESLVRALRQLASQQGWEFDI